MEGSCLFKPVTKRIKIYSHYSSELQKRKKYSSFHCLGYRPERTVSASGRGSSPLEPGQVASRPGSSSSGVTGQSVLSVEIGGSGQRRQINIYYPHENTSLQEAEIENFVAKPQSSSDQLRSEDRLKRKVSQVPSIVSISESNKEKPLKEDDFDVRRLQALLAPCNSVEESESCVYILILATSFTAIVQVLKNHANNITVVQCYFVEWG